MIMVPCLRRNVLAALGVACLLAVSTAPGARAEEAVDVGAAAFISRLADRAIGALTSKEISSAERAVRFRALLREHFAVETIARWVLGKHWRSATPDEQREYLDLFEDLMTAMYADRFAGYSGEALVVKQAHVAQDDDILVASEITAPGSREPVRVEWRVRHKDAAYKIVDVIVEGMSMGQTQRSEFNSYISQNGGTVGSLNQELRRRLN